MESLKRDVSGDRDSTQRLVLHPLGGDGAAAPCAVPRITRLHRPTSHEWWELSCSFKSVTVNRHNSVEKPSPVAHRYI